MALQGTFDTLELTAVLSLLARGGKTGTLHLDGGDLTAVVRLHEGRCCATAIDGRPDGSETPESRTTALVDVCFELARRPHGSFSFEEGAVADDGCAVDVADAVGELDGRLGRWEALRATLPSLDLGVQLAAELPEDRMELDRVGWRVLVAVDGAAAEKVLARSGLRLLEGAEALAALVDAGVATLVDEPGRADPPPRGCAPPAETRDGLPPATVLSDLAVPDLAVREEAVPAEAVPEVAAHAEAAAPEVPEPDVPGPRPAGSDPEGIDPPGATDDAPTSPRDRRDADELLHALGARLVEDTGVGVAPAAGADDGDPSDPSDPAPPERDDELRDRGALLRLFSSIRET